MANAPGQIELTQEVPTATAGDQTPSAGASRLILFPSGGLWYSKDSSGVVSLVGAVPTARLITAGAGLTGGGSLAADRTLNVVANADGSIVVNADDIQVGVLATDAQHGNRGGGGLHANAVAGGAAGFLTGADKTKLDSVFAIAAEQPATLIPTGTVTRAGSGWALTAALLAVGTHLRINVSLTCAATLQTLTPTLKWGTANSNADADLIGSTALAVGTAALGSMHCVYDVFVITSTTAVAVAKFYNGNAGITGVTTVAFTSRGSAGPITIATTASQFVAPYFISATAAAVTVRNVTYEVVAP